MSLGPCPECGQQVATSALACPNCGNTEFLIPTGNKVRGKCRSCNGTGTFYQEGEYGVLYSVVCYYCNGAGSREHAEYFDSRDNSTHLK